MMNQQQEIRNRLLTYMYDNEVTLKYVSEKSYLRYNLLSRFKNGKVELEPETLSLLNRFLDIIQDD